MKLRRIFIACLAMAVVLTTAVAVSALIGGNEPVASYDSYYPYDTDTDEPSVILDSRNGVILEVRNIYDLDGSIIENMKRIVVSSDAYEGATMVFMIDEETVFVYGDMDKLEVGANIRGFFDSTRPMIMIYPPQYNMIYVSVGHEDTDGGFIPIAPPIHQLSDEEIREFMMVYDGALIKVNGTPITNRAFVSDSNRVMVPVREVAYGLGITPVTWFGDTRTVQLGIALSFTLDVDSYAFGRMAPIELGQAPILKDNLTYVPIDLFISPILRVQPTAYMLEYDEDSGERILNIFIYEADDYIGYNDVVDFN